MHECPAASASRTLDVGRAIDLERYPLARLDEPTGRELVAANRQALSESGSCSLVAFLRPEAVAQAVAEVEPLMDRCSHHHRQHHNVYFTDPDGGDVQSRALGLQEKTLATSNRTLTCDQLAGTLIRRVYEWPALCVFLAHVLGKPTLFPMADPLARLNVMGYGEGDRIDWHFDRAEFTVTLLLQAAEAGGVFQYRRNLRSAETPNRPGVARLLAGEDPEVRQLRLEPGTLNVFLGYRSPHRITPVVGPRRRLIAVMSFMERPDVSFSAQDRRQFYGRSEPIGEASVPPEQRH